MGALSEKQPTITINSLLKKPTKIIHFNEIQSVKQEDLKISNYRAKAIISSGGVIYSAISKAYTSIIYSFEITPDIHKVVISNVNATDATKKEHPDRILAGISVKDIPANENSSRLKESFLAELKKNGYSEKDANTEIDKVKAYIDASADPFISTSTLFMQSCLNIGEIVNGNDSHELIIPPSVFKGRKEKKVYLFVSSTSEPKVTPYTYPTNVHYFYEEPAAESLTEGDYLRNSRVMLGEVHHNGNTLSGLYFWEKPSTRIKVSSDDLQKHPCLFITLSTLETLNEVHKFLETELGRKKGLTFPRLFDKVLEKIKLPISKLQIFRFDINVPVYPRNSKPFYSFVWRTNDLAKSEFVEKKISRPQKHHTHQDLFDNFGLAQIYNTPASISTTTTSYAAEQITRALLAQPKGKRSISVDGFLLQLLGGPVYEAQELDLVPVCPEAKKVGYENKEIRLTRDYLYSMVYSGPADTSTTDNFSGEGFLFYDTPIHYNNPKVVPGRELDKGLVQKLIDYDVDKDEKEKEHLFIHYLISNNNRINRAKKVFSEWMNIGDPDDKNDKRPTSGSLAVQMLLNEIFTEVHKYGIEIDYVYSDLEKLYNTAWPLRTRHRLEHFYEKTENSTDESRCPNFYDIDLYKKNGHLECKKMWDSVCESSRFQNEILPKLEARGFHPYIKGEITDNIYLSAVNQSFWRNLPTQKPIFGYWLNDNFAQRREINIWDCVMTEYTAELQQTYVMNPIINNNPKAKYSLYAHVAAKGHTQYGTYGMFFEPYLGGSIKLPKGMSSSTSIYEGQASEGHCKFNLDDYRCFAQDNSAFTLFKYEINHIRMARNDNPSGFMPFYSCRYYRETHNNLLDMSSYYRDTLFHSWLCQPEQMIAYFHYDDKIKAAFTSNYPKEPQQTYFKSCYEDTQQILNELNKIVKRPVVKTLDTPIVNECDPFILTGVETSQERIWRLTFDNRKGVRTGFITRNKKKELNIWISKKNISFSKGVIRKEDATGFWIAAPKKTEPKITAEKDFFDTAPSYYIDHPFDTLFKPQSNRKYYTFEHPQGVTIFGESAPFQIWEVKLMFDEIKKGTKLFKIDVNKLDVKPGKWYIFTARVRIPRPEFIYGEAVNRDDKRFEIELTYEGDGKKKVYSDSFPVEEIPKKKRKHYYTPITSIELGEDSGGTKADSIHCEYFKILIDKMNIRADIFRESDGVNITRVNKQFEEFKNHLIAKTSCTDSFDVRISWLNALDVGETYTIWLEQYNGKEKTSSSKLDSIKISPTDQGYKILKLPKLSGGISKMSIVIKDSTDKIAFKTSAPISA